MASVAPVEYRDVVARLSLPTAEQTRRFAQYVSAAHSWYKHLPAFPPGRPFFFFLDPHAGMGAHGMGDRAERFSEFLEGDQGFHYNWLPTVEYRARFGAWRYHVGSSAPLGELQPAQRPVEVMDPLTQTWLQVPAPVLEASRCNLTGFVHPRGRTATSMASRTYGSFESAFRAQSARFSADPFVRRHILLMGAAAAEAHDRLAEEERYEQIESMVTALMRARSAIEALGCKAKWPRPRFAPELYAHVLEAPDDDAPRLVYADALEAAGDPRGSLIQIMCELSRRDPDDAATAALEGSLARAVRANASLFEDLRGDQDWRRVHATVERGFASKLTLSANVFEETLESEVGQEPISALALSVVSEAFVGRIASHPVTARVRSLELGQTAPANGLALLTATDWPALRHLTLALDVPTARAFGAVTLVRQLESLEIIANDELSAVVDLAFQGRSLPNLRRLSLRASESASTRGFEGVRHLLAAAPSLASLRLEKVSAVAEVAAIASFEELRELTIVAPKAPVSWTLLAARLPPGLERLDLGVTEHAILALASNPSPPPLRHLTLRALQGRPTQDALAALARSEVSSGLVSLDYAGARGEEGFAALSKRGLRRLAIRGALEAWDASVLLRHELGRELVTLEVRIGSDGAEVLRQVFLSAARLARLFVQHDVAALDGVLDTLREPGASSGLVHLRAPTLGPRDAQTLLDAQRLPHLAIVEASLKVGFGGEHVSSTELGRLRDRFHLCEPGGWTGTKWGR